jgi:hypothetical protein
MWFASTGKSHPRELYSILARNGNYTVRCAHSCSLRSFWETPRTQLGALLLDLFSSSTDITMTKTYNYIPLSVLLRLVDTYNGPYAKRSSCEIAAFLHAQNDR